MKKVAIFLLSMVLLFSLIVTGCNKEVDKVGEVNGESITTAEYESHLSFLKYYYEIQAGTKLDEEKDQAVIDSLKTQTFDDLVLKKILWQQAGNENIEMTEEEIDAEVAKAKEVYGDEDYKNILEEMGMSEKQLKEQIKTEKFYSGLREIVTANIMVSEDEVEQYYEQNKESFVDKGGIQISHILVETSEEAQDLIDQIEQGGDFAVLAREHSSCASSAQGGDLGLFNQDSNYVTEFKDAAAKLQTGEITQEPVKSEFGYHIIKAGAVTEARTIPLAEAEQELHQQLLEDKKAEAFYNYLQDLIENADIVDLRNDKSKADTDN